MAKITVKGFDEVIKELERIPKRADKAFRSAVYAGAAPIADQMRRNLEALPGDDFRYLQDDEQFSGVPEQQKQDLMDALGITPTDVDKNGNYNAKIGFDGYGSIPTRKYPKGLPNQLLARSIESGSSVRQKTPFARPALNKTRKTAKGNIEKVLKAELLKKVRG